MHFCEKEAKRARESMVMVGLEKRTIGACLAAIPKTSITRSVALVKVSDNG